MFEISQNQAFYSQGSIRVYELGNYYKIVQCKKKVKKKHLEEICYDLPIDTLLSETENISTENKTINEESLRVSLSRTKKTIKEYVLTNNFDYFVTLTFNIEKIDRYNLELCKKKLSKFFDNYKQRKSINFKYLIVPELHKDGAIHFHGFFKGVNDSDIKLFKRKENIYRFIPYSLLFGKCELSPIQDLIKCSRYATKYITKDMIPLSCKQRYLCSKGLLKPKLIEIVEHKEMNSWDFENEFCRLLLIPNTIDYRKVMANDLEEIQLIDLFKDKLKID